MNPDEALIVSVKARQRAKEALEASGEKPSSFQEYQALVQQFEKDLIQEMQDEQNQS